MINRLKSFAFAAVLAAMFALSPVAGLENDVLTNLQEGGNVLVMRHASSPRELPSAETADPGNEDLERQLDDEGKASAAAMGEALRRLGIDVAHVVSSPTFRAMETARYAGLGEPATNAALGSGGATMQATEAEAATWLREQVATIPPDGSNVLLITHTPNLRAAFGDDAVGIAEGEIMVFRPDGVGGFSLLGRVGIEEWATNDAALPLN